MITVWKVSADTACALSATTTDWKIGSFQIMNSWGPSCEDGVAWVRYKDFMHFNKEAYALQPLPKRGEMAARKFE